MKRLAYFRNRSCTYAYNFNILWKLRVYMLGADDIVIHGWR